MGQFIQQLKKRAAEASMAEVPESEEYIEPTSQFKPSAYKPGDSYVWQDDDNIWDVARLLGTDPRKLMEFNDMIDPDEMETGNVLYVPVSKPEPLPETHYELLSEPMQMHVSKPGGAKKWRFGNVRNWEDITNTGFFPEGTNVKITAIAHVPIEEDGQLKEAAYYMDDRALGDYANTGRVRYTIGYSWTDLAKGQAEVKKPEEVAQQAIIEQAAKEAPIAMDIKALTEKKAEFKEMIAEEAKAHPEKYPNFYKTTYQPLTPPAECIAMLPKEVEFIWVKDFDAHRPERKLRQHQEITIAGTFEFEGEIYGRPAMAVKNGYWYGIPMDMLQAQNDVYNTKQDAETRSVSGGKLTLAERFLWVPLAKTIHHPLVKRYRQRKNKQNKES